MVEVTCRPRWRHREPSGGALARFTGDGYTTAPVGLPRRGLPLCGRQDMENSPRGSPEGSIHLKRARGGGGNEFILR
jgi:hypothetical protein